MSQEAIRIARKSAKHLEQAAKRLGLDGIGDISISTRGDEV